MSPLEGDLSMEHVVDIACGNGHSIAMIESGEVYTWVRYYAPENNITNITRDVPVQMNSILAKKKVVHISCGAYFTMIVVENGEVYSWGFNDAGQLGIGNCERQRTPRLVGSLRGIVIAIDVTSIKVVCGYKHTLALTNEGDLYAWSGNEYGQLGIGNQTNSCEPILKEITKIEDFRDRIIVLLSTSDVKIQAEGQYIHVHRDWVEKSLSIIKPDQFSYVVYKAFLKYLYTDVIELPWENVLELFALADTYCESNLKKHCIRMIKQGITVSNVAYLYSIAVKHKDEELEEFCFDFAVNHLKDVMRTENFDKLDENTLKTFIIKAAKTGAFSKI
ncbi:RCC1 and BTB domain-containing protein 1 [Trachymyrmex zeteki]|nr:RCC1 and BTB domain-containing protein 1 [Trachymyrmex zeteki]